MLGWAPGTGAVGTGAHPFNIDLNGVDLVDFVDMTTIHVELPGPGSNGSMRLVLRDPASTIEVVEWDHVRLIENAAARPITFGGFVQNVKTTLWAAGGRTHEIECVGYGILLDKRQIKGFAPVFPGGLDYGVGQWLQLLVGQFGGFITALGYPDTPNVAHTDIATVDRTLLIHSDWVSNVTLPQSIPVEYSSLRNALERWAATGADARVDTFPPVPFIYWVDPYARLHATWIPSDGPTDSYEGAITAVSDATANAPDGEVEFEGDGADFATTLLVQGDTDAGSGYVRVAGLPVAGDLEEVVSAPTDNATERDAFGGHELSLRAGARIRASFPIVATSAQDIRPGMSVAWTSAQLALSAEVVRIIGVSIDYLGGTVRRYTLDVGGRLRGSIARRSGSYRPRTR